MKEQAVGASSSIAFLSCLSGSEVAGHQYHRVVAFLSCLSGSEVCACKPRHIRTFLSCLSGSEDLLLSVTALVVFLSCLSGSEGTPLRTTRGSHFLSCLSGSEVELTVYKSLIFKEHSRPLEVLPIFLDRLQPFEIPGLFTRPGKRVKTEAL